MKKYELIGILKREIFVNENLLFGRFAVVLLVFIAFILIPSRTGNAEAQLIVLGLSMNVFFPLVAFAQVFLQEHKDRDLRVLTTLQIGRRAIVDGKMLFVIVVVAGFNVPMAIPVMVTSHNPLLDTNFFILSVTIGSSIGFVLLALYVRSSFETFLIFSQYMRGLLALMFFAMIALLNVKVLRVSSILNFSPVISAIPLVGIYLLMNRLTKRLLLERNLPL